MANEPQPNDLLGEFEAVAAAATDDAAMLEMVLNYLVPQMTLPLKQILVTAVQSAVAQDYRGALLGASTASKSPLTRYARVGNPDLFVARLEIALREILRRELVGQ